MDDLISPRENTPWLHRYRHLFESGDLVLDLGCGTGDDSVELSSYGCKVVALDLDPFRVRQVPAAAAGLRLAGDMSITLPFVTGTFDSVVSSLALHYFRTADTIQVLEEISRVLRADGRLVCRVNAVGDVNFGYGEGQEIERSLFRQPEGHLKRFFDEPMLRRFLEPCFRLEQIEPHTILQRGIQKRTLECTALRRQDA
jgi:SAM-dependent methyltransferase